MKAFLVFFCLILIIPANSVAQTFGQAKEFTVETSFPDLTPNDGIFDAGTFINPYVIKNKSGHEIGTMEADFPDPMPNDGVLDAGSFTNPYRIKLYDRNPWD